MKVLLVLSALLCIGGSLVSAKSHGSRHPHNRNRSHGSRHSNKRNRSPTSGVVICYYGSWANQRTEAGNFGVSDLPTDLCTHLVYSFLTLDGTTGNIVAPTEETIDGKSNAVADLIALKKSNANLKILVAIGGWTEGSVNFSAVVNNDTLRAKFVSNLYNYVDTNGFDGLDLDWEYPAQRDGAESDKEQFATLVKELKEAFTAKGYLLTAAVAVAQWSIDLSYNVTALNEYLDYIHLMTYDFHGTWESVTGVNAPLYGQLTDDASNVNVNNSVNVWINNGGSPSKLVLGMGSYGKTFTLTSLNNTSTGAPFTGAGQAGPYTGEAGTWSYYEICEDQKNNSSAWNITEVTGNYVYANKDLFWVGYDNPNTIYAKGQYAKNMGLGGIMFWSVDNDDFGGLCGDKYPLISQGIAGYNSV